MGEAGGDLDLAKKPLGTERGGDLGLHNLDRDFAMVSLVVGQIDGGHSPAPELALDCVPRGKGRLQASEKVGQAELRGVGHPHHRAGGSGPPEHNATLCRSPALLAHIDLGELQRTLERSPFRRRSSILLPLRAGCRCLGRARVLLCGARVTPRETLLGWGIATG